MTNASQRIANAPIRVAGLKLVSIVAALCLLFVLLTIISMLMGVLRSPMAVRVIMLLLVGGYMGYVYWLSNPRLPFLTAEDTDPMSQRVYRSALRVCQRARIPLPKVVIDPDKTANAETFGFTPRRAYIMVHEGLLETLERDDELDAVMAHEVSHIANRDVVIATVFNGIILLAQGLYSLSSVLLSVGAASGQLVGQIAAAFASAGLIGLFIALMILAMFAALLMYAAMFAFFMFVLLGISILAINAFQRQRERLADDYAAQIAGQEAMASALTKIALVNPPDRLMICQLMGIDPASQIPVPPQRALQTIRTTQLSFTFASHVAELLAPHPLTLRRVQRVLIGAQKPGPVETVLFPLAKIIESSALWLTPQMRARSRGPSDREGPVMIIGVVTGLCSALIVALLPKIAFGVALLAVGLPVGLIVGIGITLVLVNKGPFQGADVIDSALTGSFAWFIGGAAFSSILILPNDLPLLQSSWMVLIVAGVISSLGFIFLPPAATSGQAAEDLGAAELPAWPQEVPSPERTEPAGPMADYPLEQAAFAPQTKGQTRPAGGQPAAPKSPVTFGFEEVALFESADDEAAEEELIFETDEPPSDRGPAKQEIDRQKGGPTLPPPPTVRKPTGPNLRFAPSSTTASDVADSGDAVVFEVDEKTTEPQQQKEARDREELREKEMALLAQAQAAEAAGKWNEAVTRLKEAAALNPDNANAPQRLATIVEKCARPVLGKLTAALVAGQLDAIARGLPQLPDWIKEHPPVVAVLKLFETAKKGLELFRQGKIRGAVRCYESVLKEKSDLTWVSDHVRHGLSLLRQRRRRSRIKWIALAIVSLLAGGGLIAATFLGWIFDEEFYVFYSGCGVAGSAGLWATLAMLAPLCIGSVSEEQVAPFLTPKAPPPSTPNR